MPHDPSSVSAIDLFCGAGGLSLGLKQAGVHVAAGIDVDPACEYPYTQNINSKFILKDISDLRGYDLNRLWPDGAFRLLAGCAPCQPFSSHRRGIDTRDEASWNLLSHFARLVEETQPEFVTMENVTRLRGMATFESFLSTLQACSYKIDYGNLYGPTFGLPQERRRLVLVASKLHNIKLPQGSARIGHYATVKDAIYQMPVLEHGQSDPADPLHTARRLSALNLERMRASKPGGTWRDWPESLRAPCHRKASGASYQSFYGRMTWNSPSPTITTLSYNFGTGRFGHPEQDRTLTLREASILQGFPKTYDFVPSGVQPSMQAVGRLIGNAVPPAFGRAVGSVIVEQARSTPMGSKLLGDDEAC